MKPDRASIRSRNGYYCKRGVLKKWAEKLLSTRFQQIGFTDEPQRIPHRIIATSIPRITSGHQRINKADVMQVKMKNGAGGEPHINKDALTK